MPFIKCNMKRLSLFVVTLFLLGTAIHVFPARAEEGGGHGGGGAAAENEGDGEGESKKPSGNADREWAKRKSKLNIHEAKIKELTKTIQELVHMKNSGHAAHDEKGNPIDVLGAIASTHKELRELVEEYNRDREELKFRFPEEGALIERRYVPLRAQTVEQIEKLSGLDGELTRTKKKVDKKYATFMVDEVKPPPKPNLPESTIKEIHPRDEPPKRLKLSQ